MLYKPILARDCGTLRELGGKGAIKEKPRGHMVSFWEKKKKTGFNENKTDLMLQDMYLFDDWWFVWKNSVNI